jgi:hypothetical protein
MNFIVTHAQTTDLEPQSEIMTTINMHSSADGSYTYTTTGLLNLIK